MAPSATTNGLSSPPCSPFSSIPNAISAFSRGEFIIVLDSPSRENEGDLIARASTLTAAQCAFLIHHSSGYVCVPMPSSRADELGLPPMVREEANADGYRTAYTITVDAVEGTTTGISARDRALTCRLLGDARTTKTALRRPGHVVPLRARPGGIRERQGHTEAAVEFARLAGAVDERDQVGVIAELVQTGEEVPGRAERSGEEMMRRDECLAFGKRFGIPVVTIEDLVQYVEETEGKR